jgi:hypothetical protein
MSFLFVTKAEGFLSGASGLAHEDRDKPTSLFTGGKEKSIITLTLKEGRLKIPARLFRPSSTTQRTTSSQRRTAAGPTSRSTPPSWLPTSTTSFLPADWTSRISRPPSESTRITWCHCFEPFLLLRWRWDKTCSCVFHRQVFHANNAWGKIQDPSHSVGHLWYSFVIEEGRM